MASEISTIQSLKAVDAWIDVINANISGGVRTAFKASRLKFAGSNTQIDRTGTASSLPLQFPESSLTTANSVIDFTQGSVVASTENGHLAIQGEGFFVVVDPLSVSTGMTGAVDLTSSSRVFITRDGEFRTNQNGFLVNNSGYFLVTASVSVGAAGNVLVDAQMRLVYNNLDVTTPSTTATAAVRLSDYLANDFTSTNARSATGVALTGMSTTNALAKVTLGRQSLNYSQFGSTIFGFGIIGSTGAMDPNIRMEQSTTSDGTILSKSLESSNASMTQSVPELSLAQKLFSALTKVFQTKTTNVDGVINLIR
jgi:flagellar hook protein FlgE